MTDQADTLAELERLHEAATPGPWVDAPCHWGKSGVFRELPPEPEPRSSLNGKPVSRVAPDELTWQDAALIAAMRNALPGLLKQSRLAATLTSILCTGEGQDVVERAKSMQADYYGALKEMAKARGRAADILMRMDWLGFEREEEADQRCGEFKRMWDALKAARKENDSLRAALAAKDAELARMKERVVELEKDEPYPQMQSEPCPGCGRFSRIETAACDYCDYEDK